MKRNFYVSLIGIICLAAVTFLIIPIAVHGEVFNDAYSYEDNFEDTSGLDPAETDAFEVNGGGLTATGDTAVAVSECIILPQPEGSTFQEWSFLMISLADLGVGTNTLEIQDCLGNTLMSINNLPEGESSIDLSSIIDSTIRLMFMVNQVGARLNFWKIYGRAYGATCLEVVPDSHTVNAGDTVTFTITFSTSGAIARNSALSFSLNDINGLHTPDIDEGLAEDAEVTYGGIVTPCRPLEFESASLGPNGETASAPDVGATSGEVMWYLGNLSDGFSDNVTVTLRVPRGYINGKSLAASAILQHGLSSGLYTNQMIQADTSDLVIVNSVASTDQLMYTNYQNLGPGATNIYDRPYIRSPLPLAEGNPSDIENITLTIAGIGTCTPLFRNVSVHCLYTYQILTTPELGEPITGTDPVVVHFDRADFHHDYLGVLVYYDVPDTCSEGKTIGTQSEIVVGNPSWTDADNLLHNVISEVCRRGGNWTHRVMSGNDPLNYYPWPGWHEYYIMRGHLQGSLRAGEYFTTWTPYGNEGLRSHTVPLEHSYDLIEIPEGITFHGVRQANNLTRLYKDCTGTAPTPTDETFNHNAYPPHPAWKPVDITWSGAPFSDPASEDDPKAVVLPYCRLLAIKDIDNPAWSEPDYGIWYPVSLWRMCDGSYGCTELMDGTVMSLVGGTIYTYESITDPADPAHECSTYNGWTLYKESKSWPKVYSWAEKNQVPAGQIAHIIVNPENQNYASQWVNGRWVVNLYGLREYIDLAGVTGEVLTEGMNIPKPDQNVIGESCNILDDIIFHFPDPVGCSSAVSEDDEACMAWWEIAPACQPPNGWGNPIAGSYANDQFVPIYQLRLNAPILNTTPANTKLDFVAEVRTTDLMAKGADNAVDPARWSAANYAAITSVSVLELPGLDVSKAGPVTKKPGDIVTYTLELTNYGNTPNNGWYLADWLPREGENNSQFTPEYGRVFVNQSPEDVIVEYCENAGCFTVPLAATWTEIALQATTRPGYSAETVTSIPFTAHCIRLRRKSTATVNFNPGTENTILGAIDVIIPNDATLDGKWIYNRALAGASTILGSPSEVNPVETVSVRTKVSSEVVVEIEKTFEVDSTRAGWIKWKLWVHNTSGVIAGNISVVDDLPLEIIYEGLEGDIPPGWTIMEEPAIDDTDGLLRCTINQLNPDDGNPGGEDEGFITFWSRVNEGTPVGTLINNCAIATPEYGTGGESCASSTVADIGAIKSQEAIDRIETTPITDVLPLDVIKYTIMTTNQFSHSVYLKIHDQLDNYVDYVPGTFTVNGATASDSFLADDVLDYQYPDLVTPGETLTLVFEVIVKDYAPDNYLIENRAQIAACNDSLDLSSCYPSLETPVVSNRVYCDETDNDTDGVSICQRDCDDTDLNIYPGAPELCDGKDNDCDGLVPAVENDADGDGYRICDGDCDDNNPAVNPGAALDTTITYHGDFVVIADDYSVEPPTGDMAVSALLEDSASQPVIGLDILFEVYDTGGNLVASASVPTDDAGRAMTTFYNLQVLVYKIIVRFTGDDCYYHSSETSVMVAVYDPRSGFATGGGWYMAYDEALEIPIEDRVNFGFNVRYKQGASTGNLEFQVHRGNLNLKSTSIDWLVISAGNAQFNGQGRVNNTDGYFFRVMTRDLGEPGVGADEFDIKIWDGDPNNAGTSLIYSSKGRLSGGNIVIHIE